MRTGKNKIMALCAKFKSPLCQQARRFCGGKISLAFLALFILFILSFFFDLSSGSNDISFVNCVKALFGSGENDAVLIIKSIRLPRVLAAAIVGAGLAASGCVFQGILRNPLAEPFTLGVSGGAAFGASLALLLKLSSVSVFFVPFCSFCGSFISVSAVYILSGQKRFDSNAMILSGVVMSYIFSSAVMLVYSLFSAAQIQAAFIWIMGDFSAVDERLLFAAGAVIIAGTIFLCLSGNVVNAVSLGSEKSKTIGVEAERAVKIIFLTASLIAACAASVCGVIGFIGLMTPHIMRKIIGANHFALIPASALLGASFLPFCDAIARTVFAPSMLPVGVITGIFGGIFFMFLLTRNKKS
ncbi:MAG: iron ABC transporter permease [Endomicrobium sp.]|jgi:iron complex transport system permease protein|nr:iron ABC transporter permease [Endomicrobium sp.]